MSEILPRGFVFSQSNLQAFQNCRFSFMLRYIRKLPWPSPLSARSASFELDQAAGSMLHSLIHQYFLGIDAELLRSCAEAFPDARVSRWLERFLASPYSEILPNQYPEHSQQIALDGNLLLAKFDLLCLDDDEIQICDWKTSRILLNRVRLQNRIQTMVYALVAASANDSQTRSVSMHYWEADFPESPIIFEFSPQQLIDFRKTVTNLIHTIRSLSPDEFIRTTNLNHCSYCEYQTYCARVGTPKDEQAYQDWLEIGLLEN